MGSIHLSESQLRECLLGLRDRANLLREQADFLLSIGVANTEAKLRFPALWTDIDANLSAITAVEKILVDTGSLTGVNHG